MTSRLPTHVRPTANQRFHRRSDAATWGGIAAATVLHFLVFALSPTWTARVEAEEPERPTLVTLDEIRLPEPPADPPRPAAPVPSVAVPDHVTLAPAPDFTAVPDLPPPPPAEPAEELPFRVYTTPPRLLDPDRVALRLEQEYPSALRDAGIGGTVTLHVHLDADGKVLEVRVAGSSGSGGLDRAALAVAEAFRFAPALNRDRPVDVWIALPVTFRVR